MSVQELVSGTGSVAGVAITDRDGLRSHIGYLPEEPPLYEQATAYEQLEYIAGLGKLPLRISLLRSNRRAQPKHKQRADDDNHPLKIVQ